ncbi:hypothetical protein VCHC50A1_1573, partial [Vibrio cholerae HC-50A1]
MIIAAPSQSLPGGTQPNT